MVPGKEEFKKEYLESVAQTCSTPFAETTLQEKYTALASLINDCCSALRAETVRRRQRDGGKVVYYFSMEFLVGRLLENYLINLGAREMVEEGLRDLGIELEELLECERDPGLGNGGLGRLAACFMDSMAAEDMPCVGDGDPVPVRTVPPEDPVRAADGGAGRLAGGRVSLGDGEPSEAVTVRFGGRVDRRTENGGLYTSTGTTRAYWRYRVTCRWWAMEGRTVNLLRLWQRPAGEEAAGSGRLQRRGLQPGPEKQQRRQRHHLPALPGRQHARRAAPAAAAGVLFRMCGRGEPASAVPKDGLGLGQAAGGGGYPYQRYASRLCACRS